MTSRRIALLSALILGFSLLTVDSARACSCARTDPRDSLARADGAIIGTFQESHPAVEPTPGLPTSSGDDTIYTFRVDEEVKGQFGDLLEVHSAADGATCGLEVQPGQSYGLFLTEDGGAWHSNLCSQTTPSDMREAATELPKPNGQGPPWLFVGGSFGEAQLMTLDEKGRTLAYGGGGRDTHRLAMCPRGRRMAELTHSFDDGNFRLAVRDIGTGRLVSDIGLPYMRSKRFSSQFPLELSCTSRDGSEVIVFSSDQGTQRAQSMFILYGSRTKKILHEGSAQAADLFGSRAIVADGRDGNNLTLLRLRPGRRTLLGRLPGDEPGPFSINRARSKIAGVSYRASDHSGARPIAWVFKMQQHRFSSATPRGIDGVGEVLWAGKKIVIAPFFGRVVVLGSRLNPKGRFGDWYSNDAVVVGGTLYGVGDGLLIEADLPSGPVKTVRELPSPVTLSISGRRP